MKITALETIRLDEFPNVLWVRWGTGWTSWWSCIHCGGIPPR